MDGAGNIHSGVAAARQLAGLLAAGVALSAITRSLQDIRKWLPDAGLSKLRLFPQSSDSILVEQLEGRTDKSGQFLLPVDAAGDNPDILFEQAQSAEEADDKPAAAPGDLPPGVTALEPRRRRSR